MLPIYLYFIIHIADMQIQSDIVCVKYIVVSIYLVYNCSHMVLFFVCYIYIQPKVHVHVVTGIFSLGCTHLQIVFVHFDNSVFTKPEKYFVSCDHIFNIGTYSDPYRCNPTLKWQKSLMIDLPGTKLQWFLVQMTK